MSGFQVVGLILGAVPVKIAALKQYKAAHEMLRYFNHKFVDIDRLIQALEEQHFCLGAEFDIMLRAAGFEQQDISILNIEHPHKVLLRIDIAEGLHRHLRHSYDPYRKALLRCRASLGEIVRSIGGLVPGSPVSNNIANNGATVTLLKLINAFSEVWRSERSLAGHESKEGKYQFKGRIKFTPKKDELDRQIRELIEATNSLRRLRKVSTSWYDNSTQ